MDGSDNTASVGNASATATAATTAGTPTASGNNDNLTSFGSDDTTTAVAVSVDSDIISVADSYVARVAVVITGGTHTISDNTATGAPVMFEHILLYVHRSEMAH